VYNDEVHIGETIESILQQEFQDFEIIVVDDNSSDNTRDVVKSFASRKIEYIYMDCRHGGPSKPRNIGIRASKGKFIAFCDSDDIFLPDRMTDALEFMESYSNLGMTFTDARRFEDHTHKEIGTFLRGYTRFASLPKQFVGDSRYIIQPELAYHTLFYGNYILPSGVTVARKVFDKVGLFDETMTNADDWDMWLKISRNHAIGFIDKPGFRYRVTARSISSKGGRLAINRIRVLEKHEKIVQVEDVRRQIRHEIAENYFNIGYVCQVSDEMEQARKYYCLSMRRHLSLRPMKGFVVTLLGPKLYHLLKRILTKVSSEGNRPI